MFFIFLESMQNCIPIKLFDQETRLLYIILKDKNLNKNLINDIVIDL